jgi:hypothetical protein
MVVVASAVPLKVGVLSAVKLSLSKSQVSEAGSRSGVLGAAGGSMGASALIFEMICWAFACWYSTNGIIRTNIRAVPLLSKVFISYYD